MKRSIKARKFTDIDFYCYFYKAQLAYNFLIVGISQY